MKPAVIQDETVGTTIAHFGVEPKPGDDLVMVQQESQMVLISKENWPELKKSIDEYLGEKIVSLEYKSNELLAMVVQAARSEIEKAGWHITETFGDGDQRHVVFEKDGERKAWGMLDRVTCWSEAYRTICGKDILTIARDF